MQVCKTKVGGAEPRSIPWELKNFLVRSESTKIKKLLEPNLLRGFEDILKSLNWKKNKRHNRGEFFKYGYQEIKTSPFEYSNKLEHF